MIFLFEHYLYVPAVCKIHEGSIVDVKGENVPYLYVLCSFFDIQYGVVAGSTDNLNALFSREYLIYAAVINLSYSQEGTFPDAAVNICRSVSEGVDRNSSYRV